MSNYNSEWDLIAQSRFNQISSGLDITYNRFILPHLYDYVSLKSKILDAGCGVGVSTKFLSRIDPNITGIDKSLESINIAKKAFPDIDFFHSDITKFSSGKIYSTIVLNMVLHSCGNVREILISSKNLATADGSIIVSMCHPENWVKYKEIKTPDKKSSTFERIYKIPFTISKDRTAISSSLYFDRSRDYYLNSFEECGLLIEEEKEPMPDYGLHEQYPEPWVFPRFWFLKLKLSQE